MKPAAIGIDCSDSRKSDNVSCKFRIELWGKQKYLCNRKRDCDEMASVIALVNVLNQFSITLVLTFVEISFVDVILFLVVFQNCRYCKQRMTHTEVSMLYTHTYAHNSIWKRSAHDLLRFRFKLLHSQFGREIGEVTVSIKLLMKNKCARVRYVRP